MQQQSIPLKRKVLYALEGALHWSGVGWAYSHLVQRGGAIVVMYHSVARGDAARFVAPWVHMEPERFEAQMRFLARHRRVVSLSDLVSILRAGRTPPPGTVVITFDDGYLDNLEVAAPILERLRLPATLFLATGYVDRGENQWVDQVMTSIQQRSRSRLTLGVGQVYDLEVEAERDAATAELNERLIVATAEERSALLADLADQLAPKGSAPRLTMRWDDVRRLRDRYPGFELGVHTAEHVDLATHGAETTRRELAESVAAVEREVGVRPRHFSFPYERASDVTRALVREMGFESAVSAGADKLVTPETDLHAMPRVDPNTSDTLFRFWTGGAYPGLPRLLTGRA